MVLSPTQKKALCAMQALHARGRDYVTSESIAWVINPYGGLRQATIQRLEELGLLVCQADDLPYEVKLHLMCGCARHHWRLSDVGIELAERYKFVIDQETEERLESSARMLERMCERGGE
jgi:hypothetical protein